MKTTGLVLFLTLSILGVGCSREKEVAQRSVALNYWELPGSAVVVKVNDFSLTKQENERRIALQMAIAQLRGRKWDERQKRDYYARLLKASEFSYLQDVLTSNWGKTNGVTFTEKERLDGRNRFAKNVSRGRLDYEILKKKLSDIDSEYIDQFVDLSAYNAKCSERLAELNERPVATDEVGKRREFFVQYNKRVAATNALTWAAASNLWARVQKNPEEFDTEVAKYQENEAEHVFSDPDMGEVPLSFFDDDPIWKERLMNAKEGDILPPRIGDNGVLMIKILKCIPISAQENGNEPRWRLAKMFWELGAEWEPQTDDQILADLKTIRHREGRRLGFKQLCEAATITYPSGTNLLKRARAKRRTLPNDVRIPAKVRQKIEKGE